MGRTCFAPRKGERTTKGTRNFFLCFLASFCAFCVPVPLYNPALRPADEPRLVEAFVHKPTPGRMKNRGVFDIDEMFGDGPQRFFCGHPVNRVESCKADWTGIGAEGLLSIQIVIMFEVG